MLSLRERQKECPSCEWRGKLLHWLHEPSPPCPSCGTVTVDPDYGRGVAPAVIPDDIPGGYDVKNGPIGKYYSKSELRRAAAQRGWTISGETPKDPGARWV